MPVLPWSECSWRYWTYSAKIPDPALQYHWGPVLSCRYSYRDTIWGQIALRSDGSHRQPSKCHNCRALCLRWPWGLNRSRRQLAGSYRDWHKCTHGHPFGHVVGIEGPGIDGFVRCECWWGKLIGSCLLGRLSLFELGWLEALKRVLEIETPVRIEFSII